MPRTRYKLEFMQWAAHLSAGAAPVDDVTDWTASAQTFDLSPATGQPGVVVLAVDFSTDPTPLAEAVATGGLVLADYHDGPGAGTGRHDKGGALFAFSFGHPPEVHGNSLVFRGIVA